MEMLLYLMSNICCNAAGALLLYHCWYKHRAAPKELTASDTLHDSNDQRSSPNNRAFVSRDLQIMVMLGTIARAYFEKADQKIQN